MVPVTCQVCLKSVMIWDASALQMFRYEGEFREEKEVMYIADVCHSCLPQDRLRRQSITYKRIAPSVSKGQLIDRSFSAPEDGSQGRYEDRRRDVPWLQHTFWWLMHNCVAHLLIGPLPFKPLFRFHDWTSRKMHGK